MYSFCYNSLVYQITFISSILLKLNYIASSKKRTDVVCVQGLPLWRNASSMINEELFRGYRQSNNERKLNEFLTGMLSILRYVFDGVYICIISFKGDTTFAILHWQLMTF